VGIKATSPSHQAPTLAKNYGLSQYLGNFNIKYIISRDFEIFKNIFFHEEQFFFVKESKASFEIFYFQHGIFKINKYSKDMYWSRPNIIAIACTTLMYETSSCAKKDKNAIFMSLFLVKFSVAHFMENMPKVVGLTIVFHQFFALMMRPFTKHI